MHNYLSPKTADYTGAALSIRPFRILPQTGDKTQVTHEFDDGSVSVVGLSTASYFDVTLQWSNISAENHAILMDLWHSETKAAGRRRTFYWDHPLDGYTYTVRFMGPLTPVYNSIGRLSISQIKIRVEGTKP